MKKFLDDNFLLTNSLAVELFHQTAKNLPIIDYHCHLHPQEIYENKRYRNLTEIWLYTDHYKWRLMRANGVEERYITGEGSDYEKFLAYAKTVPLAIGNPLYHWSHLELRRYFQIEEVLHERTAPAIWEKANAQLQKDEFRAREIIKKSNVRVMVTTDDPADSLEYHLKLRNENNFPVSVLPSFRPDHALAIHKPSFLTWLPKLEEAVGQPVRRYEQLLYALEARIRFFHSAGGRISDHALDSVPYERTTQDEVAAIFEKALLGKPISQEEASKYQTHTLVFLAERYHELGWAMQLHINAARNNNTRMFVQLGPDTGFDSIHDGPVAEPLCRLLNELDSSGRLPKTILYSLNPQDQPVLATLMGSFQGGGIAGKMQLGSAWWFNDTKDGMIRQLSTLAECGLLGRFIGMLTDSRSFLSYTRHEYFRRILCSLIGEWVEKGEFPDDREHLHALVQNISYYNARDYFGFPVS